MEFFTEVLEAGWLGYLSSTSGSWPSSRAGGSSLALNALIDRAEASEFDPVLVARLRRQRSRRHGIRSARPE
jgi:Protein of unknown function (DUF3263)